MTSTDNSGRRKASDRRADDRRQADRAPAGTDRRQGERRSGGTGRRRSVRRYRSRSRREQALEHGDAPPLLVPRPLRMSLDAVEQAAQLARAVLDRRFGHMLLL